MCPQRSSKEHSNRGKSISINSELGKNVTIHVNLEQEVIMTTQDKLKLVLIENQNAILSQNAWIAPLGLFITCLMTLITADFKDKFYLTKEQWFAIFFISTVVFSIWFIYTLIVLCKNWNKNGTEWIISQIKQQNNEIQSK
ncbi:MAG: hypothetical protein LBJ67_13400 [Planctomycetaceae bacterium]|jgi:hypothetical protein|nr:hypothetical protein [Planctomycetaceae bacterium]